jgi:hypothetical protein
LRALLFAKPERVPAAKALPVKDADLLAYLLDALSPHKTKDVEVMLSRDTRAFARLADLYAAFIDRTGDENLIQNLADKMPTMERHNVGVIEIRSSAGFLQFKSSLGTDETGEDSPSARLRFLYAPDASNADWHRFPPKSTMPELHESASWGTFGDNERNEASEPLSRQVAEVAASFYQAMSLARRCGTLLQIYRDFGAAKAGKSLAGLTSELDMVQARVSEGFEVLRAIIESELKHATTREASLPSPAFSPPQSRGGPNVQRRPVARVTAAMDSGSSRLLVHAEIWRDAINIDVGRWRLHLSGRAAPTPELAISLRAGQAGQSGGAEPVLTLVQPSRSFDLVALDSAGRGRIALPPGESVMLVQSDAVWEIRLTFRVA